MARYDIPQDRVPLPPPGAEVFTTACDYCIVACGYKVYRWPVGREGGPKANQNALKVNYPVPPLGKWISPNQHNIVSVKGKPHHVVVIPDFDTKVVNVGGSASIRGSTLAQRCYNPTKATAERLTHPLMRVRHTLQPVSWDTALDVMAGVSKHVLGKYGSHAWGIKHYSYEFFENTYAITKLAGEDIQTPAWSSHDKPSLSNDATGLDDAGIDSFSASYEDWASAEVIFISGTDPFETKTVLFTSWIMKGPKKLIFVLPRKTSGVAWGERNGGLFVQLYPGTDTVLHLALARIILENNWQDQEFIDRWVANDWEINAGMGRGTRDTPWQWRTTWGKFGTDYDGLKKWVLGYKFAELKTASAITGIPEEKIRQAAEILAKPRPDGKRPKTSFMLEKGNYWSNNYLNTTSFATLALLCGAGNRPGQVVSRGGGHQRGWMGAAGYPLGKAAEKFPGRRRKPIDLDRWVVDGNVRFAWVIGTTWLQAMAASQELMDAFNRMTRGDPHQIQSFDKEEAIRALIQRVDSGGMVLVDSDLYLIDPLGSQFADIILPAAGWGENDFTRCNGERRLRLYAKFFDPPGEAKPDWWAVARFAKRMGFEGYDWKESNEIFEEAARFGRGGVLNYHPLVVKAKELRMKGHELLRKYGTEGIQTPIRLVEGKLVGTKRLHDPANEIGTPVGPTVHERWLTSFNTHSGKAILHKSPWEEFADFYEAEVKPKSDELNVTNGRINEIWQSGYDCMRQAYKRERWPDNFLEIHPEDARARGIESGDLVEIVNDRVPSQTGGYWGVDDPDLSYTELKKRGLIRYTKASFQAVAIVTDGVKPGVAFTNFLWPGSPANSIVPRVVDPFTNNYRYKLGKGRVRKIGESPFKRDLSAMSFIPRTL